MDHETEHLLLDSEGDVFLIVMDADGERDFERLGEVASCGGRIPDELQGEFEELLAAWRKQEREESGCLHAFEAAYARSKGY